MFSLDTDPITADGHFARTIKNYRLLSVLGTGGDARVYLAEHIASGRKVALKMLHGEMNAARKAHFFHEALVHSRMTHSHIVPLRDMEMQAPLPFFVLDYAPGGTIRQRYLKGTRLPLSKVVTLVKQVASALQYLHQQAIVHWDVKPENLLLMNADHLVLSDFGNAQLFHPSQAEREQRFSGTVAYMAPEQLQHTLHIASDQYALGITTYEWLTGVRPFTGSPLSIAFHQVKRPPPPFREQKVCLPLAVEAVVLKALAKDPDQRFASILDFSTALEQASIRTKHSVPSVKCPLTTSSAGETHQRNRDVSQLSQRGDQATVPISSSLSISSQGKWS